MKEIFWTSFAKQINGKIEDGKFGASQKVEFIENGWKICFDHYTLWSSNYSTRLTRICIPFISSDNFQFQIYERTILNSIVKLFGLQDIEIGYEEFDKRFILKSNDESRLKTLLWNSDVRNGIEKLKNFRLQTSEQKGIWEEKLPEGELELSVYYDEEINEVEILLATKDALMAIIKFLSQTKSIRPKETER